MRAWTCSQFGIVVVAKTPTKARKLVQNILGERGVTDSFTLKELFLDKEHAVSLGRWVWEN